MKINNITTPKNINILKTLIYFTIALGLLSLLVFHLLPQPKYTDGFKTLTELQEYAASQDEFIKMDSSNILNPRYETYYQKKFQRTFSQHFSDKINYLLSKLSLKKIPTFSQSFFQAILNDVTQERNNRNWSGSFVQKTELSPDSKIVVFGPIEGSFHGMVRYLLKLKELAIIDENLKITNPNYYFVFLGNVINRSPYMLEIFALTLRLLKNNPSNIIYLRGRDDFQTHWQNNTLGREIELVASQLNYPHKQLAAAAENFCSTLPLKLYCTVPTESIYLNYFVIFPFIDDEKIRAQIAQVPPTAFLFNRKEGLDTLNLDKKQTPIEKPSHQAALKAIITDIKQRAAYEEMDGLRLLPPMNATITWTVFSSTTETYRKALNFFYDAFVIITPAKELKKWTITLYNRDIRKTDKNFQTKSYYFFTGNEINY